MEQTQCNGPATRTLDQQTMSDIGAQRNSQQQVHKKSTHCNNKKTADSIHDNDKSLRTYFFLELHLLQVAFKEEIAAPWFMLSVSPPSWVAAPGEELTTSLRRPIEMTTHCAVISSTNSSSSACIRGTPVHKNSTQCNSKKENGCFSPLKWQLSAQLFLPWTQPASGTENG